MNQSPEKYDAAANIAKRIVPSEGSINPAEAEFENQAKADIGKYTVQLGAQFGVPQAQVTAIIKKTDSPADAFMCLQLGQLAKKDPETVVRAYQGGKGKGWGVIARELGIKPGSPEFHALKRGDFSLTGQPGGGDEHGHGKGHGKGKGRGRGNED